MSKAETEVKKNRFQPYSKRVRREPFETAAPKMLGKVINHWLAKTEDQGKDTPKDVDRVAERITPSNDRNCAAVFLRSGGVPLVAMNSWNSYLVEGDPEGKHEKVYGSDAYEKVQYTDTQLHAEMKILQYCLTAKYQGPYYYIGISKPCCLRCAVVMVIQGFSSRGCSGGLWDAGWALPEFVRNSPEKLEAFMGSEAYQWYKSLETPDGRQSSQQRAFIARMQNATDKDKARGDSKEEEENTKSEEED